MIAPCIIIVPSPIEDSFETYEFFDLTIGNLKPIFLSFLKILSLGV